MELKKKQVELVFGADKKHRDKYLTASHFAHPAKMVLPLQRWLIENYTKLGDIILDPMAGCGTLLIACTMGRNVILVELEDKFVKMQRDNWAKIQTIGPEMGCQMGTATILQGDARNLEGVLADVVISSPPYAIGIGGGDLEKRLVRLERAGYSELVRQYREGNPKARNFVLTEYSKNPANLGNLPYGSIDAVISSPPYENQIHKGSGEWSKSPEGRLLGGKESTGGKMLGVPQGAEYIESQGNIGNLKGESYLQSMLQVYQQCHKVLKPQGLLILVVKNFIRNKQEIRLDLDTILLCEQAGLELIESHYRKLTTQSFWRTIYQQKYPDAPVINKEDILVFEKHI